MLNTDQWSIEEEARRLRGVLGPRETDGDFGAKLALIAAQRIVLEKTRECTDQSAEKLLEVAHEIGRLVGQLNNS